MDVSKLNRSLIEIAVSQGIREIRQNTNHGILTLLDMWNRFTVGKPSNRVFKKIQDIAADKNCLYYQMVQQILNEVEEETVKCFGINVGYCSWMKGAARMLEQTEHQTGDVPSWISELAYDRTEDEPADKLNEVSEIIRKQKKKGIYSYLLYPQQKFEETPELIFLPDRFPECAFFWFFKESSVNEAQLRILKKRRNCMYLFPASANGLCPDFIRVMKEEKVLFSFYGFYDEAAGGLEEILSEYQEALALEPLFFALKASEGVSAQYQEKITKEIWKMRHNPRMKTFPVELDGDTELINHIILK